MVLESGLIEWMIICSVMLVLFCDLSLNTMGSEVEPKSIFIATIIPVTIIPNTTKHMIIFLIITYTCHDNTDNP